MNNKNVKLSKEDLEMIKRIRSGKYAHSNVEAFDEELIEFDHSEWKVHAFSEDNPKRRFIPSKWERIKVNKIVRAIKNGQMVIKDDTET